MTAKLTIVKAKLEVPEGQRYKPNPNDSESRRFEQFYSLYKKLYPDPDEREPKRRMVQIAAAKSGDDEGAVTAIFYALKDGRLVGYNQFDVITHGSVENGAFGIDWYLGVDPGERRNGYGSQILRRTIGYMKMVTAKRGRALDLVHAELDDPLRMTSEQYGKSEQVMKPEDRIRFWASNGFMEVVVPENGKVRRDWYIQPLMTAEAEEPVTYLLSSMRPLHPELQMDKEISAEVFLERFLSPYVYYGFEGIPGSNLNGLRNPDTDKSYLEMKRRIELAGKVRLVLLER